MALEEKTLTVLPSADIYAKKSTCYKVVKTVLLVFTWICIGLCTNVTGPTLLDLKQRTHANYEEIGFAVSGRMAGFFIGSAIGGVIVDKLPAYLDLILAICQVGMAALVTISPWTTHHLVLWMTLVIAGAFEGAINIAGQKIIIELWSGKPAASALHALHGGYGIGSFIIPMIANPFLADLIQETNYNYSSEAKFTFQTASSASMTTTTMTTYNEYRGESQMEYAYAIAAGITVIGSSAFFIYHLAEWKVRHEIQPSQTTLQKVEAKSLKSIINPATCAGGNFIYGLQIFFLLFFYYFNATAGEICVEEFIRTFSVDQLKFSKDDASYLNTAFFISFTIGRYVAVVTARFLPIRILILLEAGGFLLTSLFLTLFGHWNATALWIITQPLGFFVAPLFPSAMGWANHHVSMTGFGITTLLVGAGLGSTCYLRLLGYLYDLYGPRSFQYTTLTAAGITFITIILLHFVGKPKQSEATCKTYDTSETGIKDDKRYEFTTHM